MSAHAISSATRADLPALARITVFSASQTGRRARAPDLGDALCLSAPRGLPSPASAQPDVSSYALAQSERGAFSVRH